MNTAGIFAYLMAPVGAVALGLFAVWLARRDAKNHPGE